MNFEAVTSEIDELIRSGQREVAGRKIKEIKISTIPRSHINSMANLARRTGHLNLAWQMISPLIRPKFPLATPATDIEKATYTIVLLALGAIPEAVELLESANPESPEINLAFAFAHISRWDYLAAIPKLRLYLRSEKITLYEKMIAQVNLAASYVASGNAKDGSPLLKEILEITSQNNWHLLNRNALEISAQLAIQLEKWSDGEKLLKQAKHDSDNQFSLDNFFVTKWQAIISLLKNGPTPAALKELSEVRDLALKNKHWETIRDCDFYQAITTKNSDLALRLYFGTPFASYRKRLMDRARDWMTLPTEYEWQVLEQHSRSQPGAPQPAAPTPTTRVFNLSLGEENSGPAKVKPGTALYKALVAMTSDFYRPFSMGSLHSLVFSKEHFNPDSSPRRVSFLIQRLRGWFKENNLPLNIASEVDGFKLQATEPFTFVLEKTGSVKVAKTAEPAQYLALVRKLKTQSAGKALKTTEISEITKLSVRSVRYFLKWALEKNKVLKQGSGRESRYKIR